MVAAWPAAGARDPEAEAALDALVELVRAVRNLRAERKVAPSRFVRATLVGGERAALLREHKAVVSGLARLEPLDVVDTLAEPPKQALPLVAGGFEAYLPAAELFDVDAERRRLEGERAAAERAVARTETLLARPGFADKAPAHVVDAERTKLVAGRERLDRLSTQLRALDQ